MGPPLWSALDRVKLLRLRRRFHLRFGFRSELIARTPVSRPTSSETSIASLSSPSHAAPECRQGFPGQIMRCYYKDASWLWVRDVNDSQVSSTRGPPDRYSRPIPPRPILPGVRENLLDFGLRDLVSIDVWHLGLGMDVEPKVHNLSFADPSGLTMANLLDNAILDRVSGESAMRNITVHQPDGSHGTDRCGYSRIQLHDSFPAIGCGHTHYPNFDVTWDVTAAAIYAESLARMWSRNHAPTR